MAPVSLVMQKESSFPEVYQLRPASRCIGLSPRELSLLSEFWVYAPPPVRRPTSPGTDLVQTDWRGPHRSRVCGRWRKSVRKDYQRWLPDQGSPSRTRSSSGALTVLRLTPPLPRLSLSSRSSRSAKEGDKTLFGARMFQLLFAELPQQRRDQWGARPSAGHVSCATEQTRLGRSRMPPSRGADSLGQLPHGRWSPALSAGGCSMRSFQRQLPRRD